MPLNDNEKSGYAQIPPFWIHFLSGGIAGTIGAVVTCPLELVKTRYQSSHFHSQQINWAFRSNPIKFMSSHVSGTFYALHNIYSTEGIRALWKGVGATVVGVMPSRAIYFSTYQMCKTNFALYMNIGQDSSLVHLGSAVVAGIVTATATNPIWLIKTRIQLQSSPTIYKNSFDCLRRVVRQEGYLSLYQGLSASYLGCIEGTLQWVIYEKLKLELGKRHEKDLVGLSLKSRTRLEDTFLAAAVAKFVSCILTYPHEVLRTRMRQGALVDEFSKKRYSGLFSTALRIYREEGMTSFYGGMTAHLLRVVPNSAIMFFCYEFLVFTLSSKFMHPSTSSSSS